MMNKVARYRGISNGKAITKEPGYIYVTEDGVVLVDELRNTHPLAGQSPADMTAIESRLAMLESKVEAMSNMIEEFDDKVERLSLQVQMLEDKVDNQNQP